MTEQGFNISISEESQPGEARVELPQVELTGPEAKRLGDLVGIQADLGHVRRCAAMLTAHQATIDQMQTASDEDRQVHGDLSQALYTSALISYARCFATGRRLGLAETDLDGLGHEAVYHHRYYMKVRDQHTAHKVLTFEDAKVGIILNPVGEPPQIRGTSHLLLRRLADEDLRQLGALADRLIERVGEMISEQEEVVRHVAHSIGAEKLHTLKRLIPTIEGVVVSSHPAEGPSPKKAPQREPRA